MSIESLVVVGDGRDTLALAFGLVLADWGPRHRGFTTWGERPMDGVPQQSICLNGSGEGSSKDNRFPSGIKSPEFIAELVGEWLSAEVRPPYTPRYPEEPQEIDGSTVKGWKFTCDWRNVTIEPQWIYHGK